MVLPAPSPASGGKCSDRQLVSHAVGVFWLQVAQASVQVGLQSVAVSAGGWQVEQPMVQLSGTGKDRKCFQRIGGAGGFAAASFGVLLPGCCKKARRLDTSDIELVACCLFPCKHATSGDVGALANQKACAAQVSKWEIVRQKSA